MLITSLSIGNFRGRGDKTRSGDEALRSASKSGAFHISTVVRFEEVHPCIRFKLFPERRLDQ